MRRAAHCDECRHFDAGLIDAGEGWPCREGHRPRFYQPKTMGQAVFGWYGWKRRCEDFERADAGAKGQA